MTDSNHYLTLQSDEVSITVRPDLGCKIISLYDKTYGHEWLWADPNRPLSPITFGDAYDAYDISGFDECFPNIGISPYPLDTKIQLHDHGEIWSRPWSVDLNQNRLTGKISGKQFAFEFTRSIQLSNRKLSFSYEVLNTDTKNFMYLWSAHPLFKVTGKMKIEANKNFAMTKEFGFSKRMMPNGSDGSQGRFKEYLWPMVNNDDGEFFDISQISLNDPLTDKVVLNIPDGAKFTLTDEYSQRSITMRIPQGLISHLGLCFNLGAWPPGEHPASWVALEPTTGSTDKLDEASAHGSSRLLPPGENHQWNFELELN